MITPTKMPRIRKSKLAAFSLSRMMGSKYKSVVDVAVAVAWVRVKYESVVDVAVAVAWVRVNSDFVGSECTRTLEFDTSVRPRDVMA
jgi:hypothetical protein